MASGQFGGKVRKAFLAKIAKYAKESQNQKLSAFDFEFPLRLGELCERQVFIWPAGRSVSMRSRRIFSQRRKDAKVIQNQRHTSDYLASLQFSPTGTARPC
jgi:hypothetical protein